MSNYTDTLKSIIWDFAKEYEINDKSLISDKNFDDLIATPNVKNILDKDNLIFEDGVNLGLEAGFRIGLIHALFLINNLNKETNESDNEDAEVTTIPPDEINYI